MTAKRPTFRVMKNGYDRFAVDDAVEKYAAQVDELEKRIALYQQQAAEDAARLDDMQKKYNAVLQNMQAKQAAADDIARLSLREANEIISTAQNNADEIIREALGTARLILMDLSRLYNSAGDVKTDMKKELSDLQAELDKFQLPKMPDLRWLDEAEKKMR
ncbi:MAG: DivIVA domain-containing protein [Erysipelotrichaceae bacterium]|uniref:DivIVA domain-containing protein n=1 Tax=Lactimicrobium TaxID=2563777 RepID=UPI000D54D302|nr:DivIVA domain-containing protein [Lactimicrobium massiliense]MCH4020456.1 DivIVA domain-containing protein [Erysipelotrichaceae bacterium]MCI1326523.1 DivIVA domain-containing protein [Solobacterium sp.]MCH4044549.1 DivIVA domain-containing protein [Erysipelotrichaceae bacterium]MCH4121761.1 DivIVA domain-containing protein [Erysipelotrichaceae bacterium]MCI1385161.1 DivIVA domain-containing protein [Solobacterium sp.]